MKKLIEVHLQSFYYGTFHMTLEESFIFLQNVKDTFSEYENLRFIPSGYDVILYGTRIENDYEYYARLDREKKEQIKKEKMHNKIK